MSPPAGFKLGVVEDPEAFLAFHAFLQASYPRVHAALQREVVADNSPLYTLPGSVPSLPPILLLAHQDVAPVEEGTEKDWEDPPFAGEVRDAYIYGRGAFDEKGSLVAVMEAMETLLGRGFQPRRTVMLAFGHDEEVLDGGTKENILPQEVYALVNLRLHPADSVEEVLEHVRKSVAGIAGISIEILGTGREPSPVSSTTSDSYVLLAAAARAHAPEGAPMLPMLVLGYTDSRNFAPVAENVYRFRPQWILQSELSRVHGTGERLSVENLRRLVRFFAQLVETGAR